MSNDFRRLDEAYGNGGAYPDWHVLQFPRGMGRPNAKGASQAPVAKPAGGSSLHLVVATDRHQDHQPSVEEVSRNTQAAIDAKLQADSTAASSASRKSSVQALSLVVPPTEVELSEGALVRSPTKMKKSNVWAASDTSGSSGAATGAGEEPVTVPFCISSWHNKKKLVIPVEQRIAQQVDERTDPSTSVGDSIVQLAVALNAAKKEVQRDLDVKEKAQREAQERQQAALEAAEAEKAKALLEEKSEALRQQRYRKETREERMARIRLERERREREHVENQRRRVRERAAARLNVSVEALESDEALLKHVEEHSNAGGHQAAAPLAAPAVHHSSHTSDAHGEMGAEDEEETKLYRMRGNLFAGAGITQEGVQREMNALAQISEQGETGTHPQRSDDDMEEDEDDTLRSLQRRKLRRL